ncbi:hypothetical protein PGTUg99_031434 [Puccinia graminis f. sp. tritici]|uniref:Uncharacterized protein n=1 Tax=Puccinia graminis f. sp. tritici TaxID=56615 RepID=A0A5B0LUP2_PUCGR|nr:hypothetical protein PGTUg99_031434 [Puccinia graminis f. sp. tritici]
MQVGVSAADKVGNEVGCVSATDKDMGISQGPAAHRPNMTGYLKGYPDIHQDFGRKRTSAPAGGYPPADSGYPQQIIRDHL